MNRSISQITAIASLTALEAIRQPVFLLVATTCVLGIGLMPILITHTLGEAQKLVLDSALALYFVCGLILGGYAACSTLTREIRQGTVATVLSKPVNRGLFFVSKFLGIGAVMLVFSLNATLATLLSTRTAAEDFMMDWRSGGPLLAAPLLAYGFAGLRNFITRKPFASGAFAAMTVCMALAFLASGWVDEHGHRTAFGAHVPWQVLPAGALIAMAILVLAALAVSLASRLDTLPNLSLCTVVFLVGLMSDYLFGRHAADHAFAALLYRLIPNWQHFWVVDALHNGYPIPWAYVTWVGSYALLFVSGILGLGMFAFQKTDVS
ncbi:MAG TPA: hypothetical protein DCZ95_03395 [Verrucomicrobia bacterium]|nr:MAG: hypothetical protein A2X46_01570 [Lentisphaerae bacterium GWF2_57_35]HBA83118.1 hypothetical protein [Verrucomicrobiota bacterium]